MQCTQTYFCSPKISQSFFFSSLKDKTYVKIAIFSQIWRRVDWQLPMFQSKKLPSSSGLKYKPSKQQEWGTQLLRVDCFLDLLFGPEYGGSSLHLNVCKLLSEVTASHPKESILNSLKPVLAHRLLKNFRNTDRLRLESVKDGKLILIFPTRALTQSVNNILSK